MEEQCDLPRTCKFNADYSSCASRIRRLDYDYHPLTAHFLNATMPAASSQDFESRARNVLRIMVISKPKSRAVGATYLEHRVIVRI